MVWRSSRQTVSTLSTAEAELNAATLGWQIVEGLRLLLADLGYELPKVKVLIDNQAALTIATCGANWRTRYFAVRGHRLHEEHQLGRAELVHCPTKAMLADALTKLAPAPVIAVLHAAMQGKQPPFQVSTTPGRANRGDEAGDGPSVTVSCVLKREEKSSQENREFKRELTGDGYLLPSLESLAGSNSKK